jgi:selenocysteine lyase/cysteine desulfurase
VAVDYALGIGLEAIHGRVRDLAEGLRAHLREAGAGVQDRGAERSGIVSFTLRGRGPAEIKAALAGRGINVTTTTAYSTRLDMEARGLTEMVRASVHYYNTEAEVERLVWALLHA